MEKINETTHHHGAGYGWSELGSKTKGKWGRIFEDNIPALAPALANVGQHVPCPVHGGFNGYRLFEHFNDTGRGICNTCGAQKSGFSTYAWAKNISFRQAVEEVMAWVSAHSGEGVVARALAAERFTPVPRVDPVTAFARISAVWNSSEGVQGSAAERYLVDRGIPLEDIPSVLRAHQRMAYVNMRSSSPNTWHPCMLAPVRCPENKLISIHRTYLSEEGKKADVESVKKLMSARAPLRGSAIKLFRPDEVLGVAEGVETALAVRAVSRLPMWACISAVLMEQVIVPDTVKHVVIWADKDHSQRGITASEILADRLEKEGKTVEICVPFNAIPPGAKGVDWLDVFNRFGMSGFPPKWRIWRPAGSID